MDEIRARKVVTQNLRRVFLRSRAREQILASHEQIYAQNFVVHEASEIIRRRVVLFPNDEIAQNLRQIYALRLREFFRFKRLKHRFASQI